MLGPVPTLQASLEAMADLETGDLAVGARGAVVLEAGALGALVERGLAVHGL